ncbi:MAG: HNH endonuclease signature motif containing protein [Nanoarchaeota archaeon]
MEIQYYSHLCLCGCGGQIEVKEIHKQNGIPIYIYCHHRKNIKLPKEHKQKIADSEKETKKNIEFKEKIRNKTKTLWNNPIFIKKVKEGQQKYQTLFKEEIKKRSSKIHKGKKVSEETRAKQSESHKDLLIGENNPNWNNGSSFEPYAPEFNKDLKQQILERDNYICQNPNCAHLSKKLHIHHIDYDKKNNKLKNLIVLCINCHMKTNSKKSRKYYVEFYQNIITNNLVEYIS